MYDKRHALKRQSKQQKSYYNMLTSGEHQTYSLPKRASFEKTALTSKTVANAAIKRLDSLDASNTEAVKKTYDQLGRTKL